jgi:hypothetical protein
MTVQIDQGAYWLLLQLILAQRLEINAIESALKSAGVLADSQLQEIRLQASKAAEAWSQNASIDVLGLIQMHSSPTATMLVPLSQESRDELRHEINGQTTQR